MVQLVQQKIASLVVQAFIILIIIVLLNACSVQKNSNQPASPKDNAPSQTKTPSDALENWKLPISIPEGEFSKVSGWLTDEQLVYITNIGQTSNLYSYQLLTGKSHLLFKSEDPIGSVIISPSKKYLLIQAAPSTYEGKITIIDTKGNVKFSQVVPSYELSFEWNPYDESEILLSNFKEDWSFRVSLVDLQQKTMQELSIPQPFLKWTKKKQVAYLNWDNNNQVLNAPLIFHSLVNGKQQTGFSKVYQFSAFHHLIMTITVDNQKKTKAKYSFFDQKLQKKSSFEIFQLAKFSDWLVPYYDFNEKRQKFVTFRPIRSTDIDLYTEGFQLASYNVNNGKGSILMEGLNNEPLALSPSGKVCLYGNQLEKIIDFRTKKIMNLLKE